MISRCISSEWLNSVLKKPARSASNFCSAALPGAPSGAHWAPYLRLRFRVTPGAAVRRTIRRPRRFSKRIASLYYWHPALLRWIWVCSMRAVSGCSGSALIRKRCRRRTRFLPRSTIWSTSCVFYITDVLKCRAVAVTAICVIRLKQRNLPRNAGKKCGEKHWNIRRRRVVLRSDARRLDANAPSLERAAVFHGHARRKGLRDAAGHRRELWRSHYRQRAGGRLFHWHDSQRDAGRDSAPLCAIVQSRDVLRWPGALCLYGRRGKEPDYYAALFGDAPSDSLFDAWRHRSAAILRAAQSGAIQCA